MYLVVVVVHLHWYYFLVNIPYRAKTYSALLLNVVTSYVHKERWARKWYTGVQTLYLKLDFLLWSDLWKMGRTKLAAGSLNSSSSCEASVFAINLFRVPSNNCCVTSVSGAQWIEKSSPHPFWLRKFPLPVRTNCYVDNLVRVYNRLTWNESVLYMYISHILIY